MQLWPWRVKRMEVSAPATVLSKSQSAKTIIGDLPPSSSVTGHRFCAAAAITARPVVPEPVNSRWSKGSLENSMPTPPVSSKKRSFSGGK